MKNKKSFVIIIIFIIIITGFLFAGCKKAVANKTTIAMSNSTTKSISETTVNSITTTTENVFNIGDNINFNGTIVTVTKFTKSNVGYLSNPKEGMEYVIVYITIKNITNGDVYYEPHDFKMQDSKGQITQPNLESNLSSGKLNPDDEVKGKIVFEEPKNYPKLTLIYQPYIPGLKEYDSKFVKILIK